MKKVGFCETERWKEQAFSQASAWHESTSSLTPANKSAYKAGYYEGYRAAISALKMHGFIEVDKDK